MLEPTALPIAVIACKVFENLIEKYLPEKLHPQLIFLDYGLHSVPRNLKRVVQEKIDGLGEPSLVILGYGLCGNGLHGIQAGPHILVIPRTDDCIALLLGSYDAYRKQFDHFPGTYYLSKGWLESGSTPLGEYQTYLVRYGEPQASWLMDQQYHRYLRLVFVAQDPTELVKYRPAAMEVAAYCQRWGMLYEEILGSDAYIRGLVETALALEKADSEFIVVPPGGTLDQIQFIRW